MCALKRYYIITIREGNINKKWVCNLLIYSILINRKDVNSLIISIFALIFEWIKLI